MRILSESRIELTPAIMDNRTFRRPESRPRSTGIHVQAVNKALGVAAGKMTPDEDSSFQFEKFSSTCYPLLPALGVAWEEFRASCFSESELLWQPFELERDGIYGTPDGLLIDQPETELWECKLTTGKVKPVQENWMYMKQGLSYCAMSGERRVRYEVCHVLGDYTRPYKPIAIATRVEFSERECEMWWKCVVEAAKQVKGEVHE